ncbi:MAG: hypothetical protein L3K07_00885 [Thermoplasmata archaeon]|nr:hypothetical protein [Thermoplasmata archaeon]
MSTDPLPFATRVVRATKGSGSLRATIPQVVAATLGLRPGDWLSWIPDPVSGEVRVERVGPSEAADGTQEANPERRDLRLRVPSTSDA